ncbi:MAG TPA: DUF2891 domain-containing protein [Chitinophagaceae bacterium]|nr:DUF2891 domain-containing protein [Chitinophagaceae bacterium]
MPGKYFFLLALLIKGFAAAAQEPHYVTRNGQIVLTQTGASHFALLPLRCAEKELPYKTGITFGDSSLITAPKNYHPAFFGCFDWHSSVHGHWMLVRLLKLFPGLPEAKQVRELFNKHFTEANIRQEIRIFLPKDNKSFERTYGWAWLLQLQDELLGWNDADAQRWAAALQPLATELSKLTCSYLSKLVYPIRVGEHSNLAFGLSMMYDYAVHRHDTALSRSIKEAAMRFYFGDKNCPFSWEPGGSDFLSPCLEEADLMRKVLPASAFISWLKKFMPLLFDKNFTIKPGEVKDRTDGKLVHLDGLNLSRAWCLKGMAAVTKNEHLLKLANEHLEAALPQVASGNYEGEHWLASFAVYALTSKQQD